VFAPTFPAKKREVTHAIKPQGFTAADMPLVKVKRLKEVRVELCTFSAIIAFACLNFLAWGSEYIAWDSIIYHASRGKPPDCPIYFPSFHLD
jgi:hypothetical protein